MNNFSNQYVKKEYKNKLRAIIIGAIFILIGIYFIHLREGVVKEKLGSAKDMHETILMDNNEEKSSFVKIYYYPYGFADYQDDKDNAYYIVADDDYYYIIFSNKEKIDKLSDEELKFGYEFKGVTRYVQDDVKKLAVEAFNDLYKDSEGFEPITISDFDYLFGNIYLDTTLTNYGLTTEYNIIIVLLMAIGLIIFILSFINFLSYKKRLKKLSIEEASLLDSEISDPSSKLFENIHLFLTKNYVINFTKFEYFNYKDIKWVYTYIQRTNGIKTLEQLILVTVDGKTHTIAQTSGSKKMQSMYEEIYEILTSKNKDIRIGYTDENIKKNIEENKELKKEKKLSKSKKKEE